MLRACDIDHDGRISFDEFSRFCTQTEKELWQLFQSIDRDHSGKLDKTELSLAFERAGVAVSNARLDRFFNYIDKDHDGTIDFSEWRGRQDQHIQRRIESTIPCFKGAANAFAGQTFSSSYPPTLQASRPFSPTTNLPRNLHLKATYN
jgi:hypothetical protein